MMRTLLMGKKEIRETQVEYYPLAEDCGEIGECYGVEVVCSDGEAVHIPRITLSQSRILMLLSTLMEYLVTPTTLRDVVEDWVAR